MDAGPNPPNPQLLADAPIEVLESRTLQEAMELYGR